MTVKNPTTKQLEIINHFARRVYQEIGFDIPEGPIIEVAECVGDARRMENFIRDEEDREAMESFRALPWKRQARIIATAIV